jgi:phenylacetate-CoA ligase
MDEVLVSAELLEDGSSPDERDALARKAAEALRHHCQVRLGVELVAPGTYERATLKAKRVVDRRPAARDG